MANQRILSPTSLGVIAAALILVSGSAYAAQSVARNSVGTKQVRNNSLLSKDIHNNTLLSTDLRNESVTGTDIRNGSIGKADFAVGAVPEVHTFIGTVPGDGVAHQVLNIPDFSRFEATCSASFHTLFVRFGPPAPIPPGTPKQSHGIAGSDIADNQPVGGATVTGTGGGVGFSNSGGAPPGSGILVRGDYWGRSATKLAHGTWSLSFPSASGCTTRIQVVVERLATPVPVPRALAGAATTSRCEGETGAAFCRLP